MLLRAAPQLPCGSMAATARPPTAGGRPLNEVLDGVEIPRVIAKRVLFWLGLALSALAALYCCNLILYHLWASDVPPYEAAWHLRGARYAVVALTVFLALGAAATWALAKGRSKRD